MHVRIWNRTLFSSFYTRHDQACLLWGIITFSIFGIAQFAPMGWATQAAIASILTLVGSGGMAGLIWHYIRFERIAWILYTWMALMLLGLVLTDMSLYLGWAPVLESLCSLWLSLCGAGYLLTGGGMKSRLILVCGGLHWVTIALLPWLAPWHPLATGIVIGGCVTALAEVQWDADGICEYQVSSGSMKSEGGND